MTRRDDGERVLYRAVSDVDELFGDARSLPTCREVEDSDHAFW